MRTLILTLIVAAALTSDAETLRLKFSTTVEVVDDAGKVVGTKKLPAKTVIEVVDTEKSAAPASNAGKLTPSGISPAAFKLDPPKSGAVLRATAQLDDYFEKPFAKEKHYSVKVWGMNDDWSIGEQFYGYVEKATPVGKKVFAAIKDGKEHKCLLHLKYHGDKVVTIHGYQEHTPPAEKIAVE